ncbi:MAG TPA: DUF2461 domain-containing protein [Spirochaetia bacterium]|nr:DUF2461 domain-containing protein [Spirochaetia bacterium]
MAERIDLGPVLKFLAGLAKNNNKPWFEAHREQYEESMATFQTLVGLFINGMSRLVDLDGLNPKDCIMRIYRDVRFSKDKSPYKTGLGAGIAPGGRKSGRMGFHVQVGPDGATMVASGLWDPTPQQLSHFRNAIVDDAGPFLTIIGASAFRKHFGKIIGESLKTTPRGYPPDHPQQDLLRRKQVCVSEKFPDSVVTSAKFPELAIASMEAMKPFIDYLNEVALRA